MEERERLKRCGRLLVLLAASCLLGSCTGNTRVQPPAERTIALTYDDVTLGQGPYLGGVERTNMLIEGLRKAGVSEAMFFVTTGFVESGGAASVERVRQYTAAGHVLGNHSHTHTELSSVDTGDYVADLDTATGVLASFDSVLPFYRFPYLDEGRSPDKRDALRAALEERGLANGYVTVDTWDWFLAGLVQQAVARGSEIDDDRLRDLYVELLVEGVEFYDELARETLGRSPHHVLLLHENDLAAMYVTETVAALRAQGFRIVPASVAFTDPVARATPDTLHLSQGRIAAIAAANGREPGSMKTRTQDREWLTRRFEEAVLSRD